MPVTASVGIYWCNVGTKWCQVHFILLVWTLQNAEFPSTGVACLAWHDVKISWTASEHCICIYTILSACSCVSGCLLVHMHTLHKLAVWRRAAIFGIMNQYRRWIFLLISVVQLWILFGAFGSHQGLPKRWQNPFLPDPEEAWWELWQYVYSCTFGAFIIHLPNLAC